MFRAAFRHPSVGAMHRIDRFERIHRSNLIGMGILPLRFASGTNPDTLEFQPGDKLDVDAPADTQSPRCMVRVQIAPTPAAYARYAVTHQRNP